MINEAKVGKPFLTLKFFNNFKSKKDLFKELEDTPVLFLLLDLVALEMFRTKFENIYRKGFKIPREKMVTFNYYYKVIKDSFKKIEDSFIKMMDSYYKILPDNIKYWFDFKFDIFVSEFIDYVENNYSMNDVISKDDLYVNLNKFLKSLNL